MSAPSDRIESIFAGAVALPVENRADYLDNECAGDPVMSKHIEALLHAHERSSHLLDRPVPGGPEQTIAYVASEKPGTVVAGRYKLLEAIGEGGMGSVWVAEQTEPVRRKVALKLIKAGMDSRSVLARFEAERQALAMMDHPNIAKVLDGGLTEQGRPYFVMEYVKGVPITEYCDATRLSVQERLTLFMQVCQAVQHAHQKGIIHRDLKPSNILVAPYDDKPVPKIIDFGLAKAMHQSLTERTLHTAHESVLGTPLYMSPEQAQLNNLDVDTRSDIYSLGVLLYELLTGTTPLEKQRFKQAAWDEVRRIIREEEPPRPSTRLSSIKTLPALAAGRQTEPMRLAKLMQGELDWIVMKALEKDRGRRYETANGFARDIQRYLNDEVVEARPSSTSYRLKKWVQRHRPQFIAASFVALSLLVGVIGTILGLFEARRQRDIAELARQSESVERQRADQEADVAQAVNEFLTKDILGANPYTGVNASAEGGPTVLQAIEKAAKLVGQRFPDRPLVEAAVRRSIGNALLEYRRLDAAAEQLEQAIALYRRALGDQDNAGSITATLNLAWVRLSQHRLEESERLHTDALHRAERILPEDHKARQVAMDHTAYCLSLLRKDEAAEQMFKRSIDIHLRTTGETPGLQMVRNNLALMYFRQGRFDAAEQLYRRALEEHTRLLGGVHPNTVLILDNLSQMLLIQARYTDAEPLLKQALAGEMKGFGSERMNMLLPILGKLQLTYTALRRWSELCEVLRQKIDLLSKIDQPFARESRTYDLALLGMYQVQQRKYSDAEPNLRECLAIREKTEPDAWSTFNTKSMIGGALLGQKKYVEAEPLLLAGYEGMKQRAKTIPQQAYIRLPEALERLIQLYTEMNKPDEARKWKAEKEKYPEGTLTPKTTENNNAPMKIAQSLLADGKGAEAIRVLEKEYKERKEKLGQDHPDTHHAQIELGKAHLEWGEPNITIQLLEEVLKDMKAIFPERTNQDTVMYDLARAYRAVGKHQYVVPMFEMCVWLRKAKLGPDHPNTLNAMRELGSAYRDIGKLDLAEPLLTETARKLAVKLGATHPETLQTKLELAKALLAMKKHIAAEPLLLEVYEGAKPPEKAPKSKGLDQLNGLQQQEEKPQRPQDRARLAEAVDRLIQLYTETNKPDEVKKWQAEKDKLPKEPAKK